MIFVGGPAVSIRNSVLFSRAEKIRNHSDSACVIDNNNDVKFVGFYRIGMIHAKTMPAFQNSFFISFGMGTPLIY